jgi:hypothetical protein
MTSSQQRPEIARLWVRFAPLVDQRLTEIENLVAALANEGTPTPDEVSSARFAAHNLAGTLGTFGRPEAGLMAREIFESLEDRVPAFAEIAPRASALRVATALD